MYGKPLYQAEKQIEYQKHLDRLKKIETKKMPHRIKQSTANLEMMHRIRNKSSQFHLKEKRHTLDYQNNKILTSIIEIADRKKIPSYSTIVSHNVPKQQPSRIIFNNPQRKRIKNEIHQQNDKLARRLLSKQSEFDRHKVYRAIDEYEKIKATMKNNRRVRLVPVKRDQHGFDFTRISTVQNSRVRLASCENSNQEAGKDNKFFDN